MVLLTENHSLVNSDAIAIMLGCFLYLAIAFKVGWSSFLTVDKKFSSSEFLRLITAFEKKLFSSIATSSLFVIRVLSSLGNFIFSEGCNLF